MLGYPSWGCFSVKVLGMYPPDTTPTLPLDTEPTANDDEPLPPEGTPKGYRSGFVALIGRPNVGKSTLLNRLVGQKIAITSRVAQTTRHRIKGIVTSDAGQVIFLDTPGLSKPLDKLGHYLCEETQAALAEADAYLVVVDITLPPGKGDQWVLDQAWAANKPLLLVLNKADSFTNNPTLTAERLAAYTQLIPQANFEANPDAEPHAPVMVVTVSAKTGLSVPKLLKTLLRFLPKGPRYYDEEAVTDQRLREMSAEIIREKIMRQMAEEIPHSVAVIIENFDETDDALTRIEATLYVDKASQKPLLIGAKGQRIKALGVAAREDLEVLLEKKVFLGLNVKVKPNWRKDSQFLKQLGWAAPEANTN